VVLLDVEMPVLNGPDMAYELFVHNCGDENIPIILVSGNVDLPGAAAQVGTPYFLAKPYDADGVFAIVDRALAERTPPRPRAPEVSA
jgi:FixJ family two-component response regulator